ncbi:MAG TPA: hypothetical protein VKX24_13040 [Acidimicrobiia bacterium]|nr:hypothetical protein [Acidimicrobiia bacterium]
MSSEHPAEFTVVTKVAYDALAGRYGAAVRAIQAHEEDLAAAHADRRRLLEDLRAARGEIAELSARCRDLERLHSEAVREIEALRRDREKVAGQLRDVGVRWICREPGHAIVLTAKPGRVEIAKGDDRHVHANPDCVEITL